MIFNTKNQLFIVDILGRNVGDFPVQIKDSATGNVSVMDYDKNQNFRFLIPTTAGIKSVNKAGKLVTGWNQPKTTNLVQESLEHLTISSLDYVMARDIANKLYFYNRKGEIRHSVDASFGTPFYLLYGSTIKNTRAIFHNNNDNTISRQLFSDEPPSILLSPSKEIKKFFFVNYNSDLESLSITLYKLVSISVGSTAVSFDL